MEVGLPFGCDRHLSQSIRKLDCRDAIFAHEKDQYQFVNVCSRHQYFSQGTVNRPTTILKSTILNHYIAYLIFTISAKFLHS